MKAFTFEWDGETFELLDSDRWTLGETRAVERWLDRPIEDLSMTDTITAMLAVSVKRARPGFLLQQADDFELTLVGQFLEHAKAGLLEQRKGGGASTPPDGGDVAAPAA